MAVLCKPGGDSKSLRGNWLGCGVCCLCGRISSESKGGSDGVSRVSPLRTALHRQEKCSVAPGGVPFPGAAFRRCGRRLSSRKSVPSPPAAFHRCQRWIISRKNASPPRAMLRRPEWRFVAASGASFPGKMLLRCGRRSSSRSGGSLLPAAFCLCQRRFSSRNSGSSLRAMLRCCGRCAVSRGDETILETKRGGRAGARPRVNGTVEELQRVRSGAGLPAGSVGTGVGTSGSSAGLRRRRRDGCTSKCVSFSDPGP
jgi:hypothetical protein